MNQEEIMNGTRLYMILVVFVVVAGLIAPAWSADEAVDKASTPETMNAAESAPAAEPMDTPEKEAQAETPAAADTDVRIQDAVVCQDIVDRQPVGSGDVFAKESPRVFCFVRVVGAAGETKITHNWYYQGNLKASVDLMVRSDNWRTWSSKTIDPAWTGEWMVEILSEQGTPLESIIFYIQ